MLNEDIVHDGKNKRITFEGLQKVSDFVVQKV